MSLSQAFCNYNMLHIVEQMIIIGANTFSVVRSWAAFKMV